MSANITIDVNLLKHFKKGFKPDPLMSVNKWADSYRVLPRESSSEPGDYRTERMPYLEEIACELSPQSKTTEVTVIKGTQLGFTELGNNLLFCYAHLYPCPMLQVLPTESAVRTHATSKIWPSIKASPVLNQKIRGTRTKDGSSKTELIFDGGSIMLGWSNSPTTFASNSRRVVILDDIDRWPSEIEGGDPVDLGINRAEGFPNNKKIYVNSSPAKKTTSKIQPRYENGSQALYTMKCPHCGEDLTFEKDGFKFEHDEDYILVGNVVYVCPTNGCIIEEYEKYKMMKKSYGARYVHKYPERLHKSYRVPSYYSPFAKWNEMFQMFLNAFKDMKQKNETIKMAGWVNTKDAQVWEEKIEKIDVNDFKDRHEEYNADVPNGAFILTAGVDTQDDRLEVEVVAWGKYGESWSIDKKILEGDPQFPRVWEKLDRILQHTYRHESGIDLKIMGMGIDSGGHKTEYVYNYCRIRSEMNVFCLKGDGAVETPILKSKTSRVSNGSLTLYMVGVNSAKDVIYGHLKTTEVGPGYMHFPNKPEYNDEHFKQLTSEKKDKITSRWSKFRARNEALDLRVYSMASLKILESQYYPNGMDWDEIETEFNMKVENELNTSKNIEEDSKHESDYEDWRDKY